MADAKDFLFEIGTEEMPSAPLNNAVKQLGTMIAKGLDEAGLAHGEVRVISSPRRLAALVADVATATDEVHEVKRGPAANIAFDADGNATKAAQGFARKCGVAAEDLVRREDTDGREYVFAEKNIPSAPATPILTALCEKTIAGLQWPNYRSQRWGHEHATFVRPVRWICCLLGEDVVPVSFADVTRGNTTRGHRVLGPGDHTVASPAVYEQVLEDAGVLSAERRREAILAGIAEVEVARPGCHVDTPKKVFEEVINLCEWPTVLVGTFDEEFLKVPHEIICESMLTNQRYFPIYDGEGKLTREFVVVSNSKPENAERVIDGNERVVRARLDDAKFFYEEDLKISLDEFRERAERADEAASGRDAEVEREMERIERRRRRREERRGKQAAEQVQQPAPELPKPREITEGAKVRMAGQEMVGVVQSLKGRRAQVAFGQILTTVDAERLTPVSNSEYREATRPQTARTVVSVDVAARRLRFRDRIDVRGMRAAEALEAVQDLVDDALMVGVGSVSILHGKGTGALKEEVRRYLRTVPEVVSADDEHADRGGAGITVVTFRAD